MQPYQEEYLTNLNDIAVLMAHKKGDERSFEEYYIRILRDRRLAEQKVKHNMELLRNGLFPVLDRLFDADGKDLQELQEFAGRLLESDVGLFCQIHQALLNLARLKKDRCSMIEELYWLGIGRNNFCNRLVGLELEEGEKYTSQMRLCFIEAAAYLKYFDEIEDTTTRGYIFRSRANMALGRFKTASDKVHMLKQTLQILQDKEYQKKEPNLPWDKYIYMTHQLMAASISFGRKDAMSSQDIADIMESVYLVYQTRLQEAEEKNVKPPIRPAFSYYAMEYYCGLNTLEGLLTRLEELMDAADVTDFSADSMYGIISIPAFYCQYLQEYPELTQSRKEYIESLYKKVLEYVEAFPKAEENESLFLYLRQLSVTFVETDSSISYGDFLQKLQIRFAPEVYIHSQVVGTVAEVFCKILLEEEPSFFDDIDFLREMEDPDEKRQKILYYAKECGVFHDVGKMNFMNLYSHMARQWFEDEYEMAHLHTTVGEACLTARASTCHYAAIALGHHSWYDGSKGYPAGYRRLECQYRQMVDVIGLIDWLDNVTETDRLYTGVEKTFEEALRMAISLEGKRFSPLLTVRLRDKEVAGELEKAFQEGRIQAYRKLFEAESGIKKSG